LHGRGGARLWPRRVSLGTTGRPSTACLHRPGDVTSTATHSRPWDGGRDDNEKEEWDERKGNGTTTPTPTKGREAAAAEDEEEAADAEAGQDTGADDDPRGAPGTFVDNKFAN